MHCFLTSSTARHTILEQEQLNELNGAVLMFQAVTLKDKYHEIHMWNFHEMHLWSRVKTWDVNVTIWCIHVEMWPPCEMPIVTHMSRIKVFFLRAAARWTSLKKGYRSSNAEPAHVIVQSWRLCAGQWSSTALTLKQPDTARSKAYSLMRCLEEMQRLASLYVGIETLQNNTVMLLRVNAEKLIRTKNSKTHFHQ